MLQMDAKGRCRIFIPELTTHFEEAPYFLSKWEAEKPYAVVYYDGEKDKHMVKRCVLEPKNDQWEYLISDHGQSEVLVVSAADQVDIEVHFKKVKGKEKDSETVNLQEFIAVKGWKAAGNQLASWPIKSVQVLREENDEVSAGVENVDSAAEPLEEDGNTNLPMEEVAERGENLQVAENASPSELADSKPDPKPAPAEIAPQEKPSITLEVVDLTQNEPPMIPPVSDEDDADQEEDGQFTLKF